MEEFADFSSLLLKHADRFEEAGLMKIIPPPGFCTNHPSLATTNGMIVKPIKQHVQQARTGAFSVINIERKSMPVTQFHEAAETNLQEEFRHTAPASNAVVGPPDDFPSAERQFWRNVTRFAPMYGADILGSLFERAGSSWNLRHIRSLLSVLERPVPGVNEPYLYFGMWRALFAWHTEDVELYSVNYVHFGASKNWYVVPPKWAKRFERLAQGLFSEQHHSCAQFLRHKLSLVTPSLLQTHGIPVGQVTQHAGEFMVTFPSAYHMGFNQGFNVAESMNFALENWLPYARDSEPCLCRPDTVRFNIDAFEHRLRLANAGLPLPQAPVVVWISKQTGQSAGAAAGATTVATTNLPQPEAAAASTSSTSGVSGSTVDITPLGSGHWRAVCMCGLEVTSETHPDTVLGDDLLFECTRCGAWGHVNCYPEYRAVQSAGELPEEMFCCECVPSQKRAQPSSTSGLRKRSSSGSAAAAKKKYSGKQSQRKKKQRRSGYSDDDDDDEHEDAGDSELESILLGEND